MKCQFRMHPLDPNLMVGVNGMLVRTSNGTTLAPIHYDKDGYGRTVVAGKIRPVHHLVLEAHVGFRPEGKTLTRHLDGDKTNNHVTNLAWGTSRENEDDSMRLGQKASGARHWRALNPDRVPRGDQMPNAKLRAVDVVRLRTAHANGTLNCVSEAKAIGCTRQAVWHAVKRITWKSIP